MKGIKKLDCVVIARLKAVTMQITARFIFYFFFLSIYPFLSLKRAFISFRPNPRLPPSPGRAAFPRTRAGATGPSRSRGRRRPPRVSHFRRVLQLSGRSGRSLLTARSIVCVRSDFLWGEE